ncbi:hypothetical protein [Brevundimonas sp.]|uniref:hypothetical protein n=1 Tax=Brevundimonas sp. TaxID=1871086 RepID=UPI0027320F69|nr:hypothetical protein [Brevundimonas sp.]MDP1914467.1 hypothetical protein [Brevundimonas sp.]
MTQENLIPDGLVAGSRHTSDVVTADDRFFAQADNTLVAVLPLPFPQVQVTFLSIRVRYLTQTIEVVRVDASTGMIEGLPPSYQGESQATDIGGVRFNPDIALDLGLALIAQAKLLLPSEIVEAKIAAAGLAAP